MNRTFCTVIADKQAHALLWPYAEIMGRARHWCFKQIHVDGCSVAQVKKHAQLRFGITARQFNGLKVDLDQASNAWKGTTEYRITNLKDSIEATGESITRYGRQMDKAKTDKRRASLKFQQVGKKQRLDILKGELDVAERELGAGKPVICFGGRKSMREGDLDAWRAKRASRIFLVGSKDETGGNQSVRWDGNELRLRLPNHIFGGAGGFTTLNGVKFRYGQEEVLSALHRKTALTWLIFLDDDNRWHAHVTVDEPKAQVVTSRRNGVVAVDVNVGHLAVTIVDRYGNPTSKLTLAFPPSGTDEGRAAVILGDTVRALCLLAKQRGYAIGCEDLEFSKKKAGLREYGAAHARRLSGWSYARFYQLLHARCGRDGVELVKVNPAFTSVIGKVKYARCRAMSTHHAAALVIGRAAQGYGERFVTMDGTALTSPVRMKRRIERNRWRGVRPLSRETRSTGVVSTVQLGVGLSETDGRALMSVHCSATVAGALRRRGGISPPRREGNTSLPGLTTGTDPRQVGEAVALATNVSDA